MTRRSSFRIWQVLFGALWDWLSGADRAHEAARRAYFKRLRIERSDERRRMWEAQRRKRH